MIENASLIIWVLAGLAALVAGYATFLLAHARWGKRRRRAAARPSADGAASSLDGHIATQWTEGRLRLDTLLALLRALNLSLEQDVQALKGLDPSAPRPDNEARQVKPMLRRFTFDTHLRNECRTLVPLLQFCAKDLMESQGKDLTQKLDVLAKIQAAIEQAGPH